MGIMVNIVCIRAANDCAVCSKLYFSLHSSKRSCVHVHILYIHMPLIELFTLMLTSKPVLYVQQAVSPTAKFSVLSVSDMQLKVCLSAPANFSISAANS